MAAIYNFPQIKQGNTFKTRNITIDVNGSPLDLTGAIVCMQLRQTSNASLVFEFPITISDAINGKITIQQFNADFRSHIYQYDLKITTSDGVTLTYIKGSFEVLETISKC